MLLLHYEGQHTVRSIDERLSNNKEIQPELLFEIDGHGKVHVADPTTGVRAIAKSDVLSWGTFGVIFGAIARSGRKRRNPQRPQARRHHRDRVGTVRPPRALATACGPDAASPPGD